MQGPDPIRGRPGPFDDLEATFRDVKDKLGGLDDELDDIRFRRDEAEFKGQAADAFGLQFTEIDNQLNDLGDITESFARIFGDHADQLRALQHEAGDALARATTNWNDREAARADKHTADANIDYIRSQIDQLTDTDGGAQRNVLERRLDCYQDDHEAAMKAETSAMQALESERAVWNRLSSDQEALDEETAAELRSVDLGVLANPSWIEQRIDDIQEWGLEQLEKLKEAVLDILMHYYEYLEIVGVVLVMVGVLLAPFTGGTSLVLVTAAGYVGLVKAAVGLVLFTTGRIDFGDFVWDIVAVVSFAAGKVVAKHGAKVLAAGAKKLHVADKVVTYVKPYVTEFGEEAVEVLRFGAEAIFDEDSRAREAVERMLIPTLSPIPPVVPLYQVIPKLQLSPPSVHQCRMGATGW